MRKSKYVFLILAVIYLLIAVSVKVDFLEINGIVLFALAVSALSISIGETISKFGYYLFQKNNLNAILKLTVDFLDGKINQGITNSKVVNIRNLNENIKLRLNKRYVYCHPMDYSKKKLNIFLHGLAMFFFVIGIASFIGIPFIKVDISNNYITIIVTSSAFAFMNFSLFIDELISEKQNIIDNLLDDKHLIIQSVYPDFQSHYQFNMIYRNDLIAAQKQQEEFNNWMSKFGTNAQ